MVWSCRENCLNGDLPVKEIVGRRSAQGRSYVKGLGASSLREVSLRADCFRRATSRRRIVLGATAAFFSRSFSSIQLSFLSKRGRSPLQENQSKTVSIAVTIQRTICPAAPFPSFGQSLCLYCPDSFPYNNANEQIMLNECPSFLSHREILTIPTLLRESRNRRPCPGQQLSDHV